MYIPECLGDIYTVFGCQTSISNIACAKWNSWTLPKTCYTPAFLVSVIATPRFRHVDLKSGCHPRLLSFSHTPRARYHQPPLSSSTSSIQVTLTAGTLQAPHHHCCSSDHCNNLLAGLLASALVCLLLFSARRPV